MTLDQVPAGANVFVDANILVYHFQPHPSFGPMCHRLIERIERQEFDGFTSAGALPGWAGAKVLNRLKRQPAVVPQLSLFQTAVEAVLQSKIRVLPVPGARVGTAATLSRLHSLRTNDASWR